jgi:hypothetical protein
MSIRTTVTLDDDAAARVKQESLSGNQPRCRTLKIKPSHMGYQPGLHYDSIESLLEYGEGERRR